VKTTFTCLFGTFSYSRILFGLCNDLLLFAVYVEHHFRHGQTFLEVFMDDFSVFGSDFDEGLYHLILVLIRFKEKNLVLN